MKVIICRFSSLEKKIKIKMLLNKTPLFGYEIVIFVTVALIYIIYWYQYKITYWKRRGVIGPKPEFIFGNIRNVILRKEQFFQPYYDNYFKYKNLPFVGMYSFHQHVLSIHDPDIAKLVLIKDFEYFQSRGTYAGGPGDPLAANLFNIFGKKWKSLRLKLTPAFTPGKLKAMFPIIQDIANQALKYIDRMSLNRKVVNFSEFYSKYSMEIIGDVGFGVKCNGFVDSDSEFYIRGHEYFDHPSLYWRIIRAFAFFAPETFGKSKLKRISSSIENFFYGIVKSTIDYREKNFITRNDFLQMLIELKNKNIENEKDVDYITENPFTMTDVVANTMLYMIAGYETSATTGQFAAYQLALNPDIQIKARKEIVTVLAKYNGECTYEAQNEMVYLNMILDETMRLYPSMRALFRRCNKDYKLPSCDLVIEQGTLVFIPIHAIHMDSDIFPDPEKFDPERFLPTNKAKLHPCHWMPFGEGPRKCLGLRQGYVQSKMALIKVLQKYEILVDEKTKIPVKIKSSSLVYAAEKGIWLRLRRLDKSLKM